MNADRSNFDIEIDLFYRLRFERGIIPDIGTFYDTRLRALCEQYCKLYAEIEALDFVLLGLRSEAQRDHKNIRVD